MLGTDFELFMKVGDTHIPVPDSIDIGSKFGKHVKLGVGTMHRDNVMVELCPNPVECPEVMSNNVTSLVNQAETYLSIKMGETVSLSFEPTMRFAEDALATESAQELGCETDWLANNGTGTERSPMSAAILGNDRCSGGHIHMSYGATDELPEPVAVHFADLALGSLEVTMGSQGKRREFYGIPGLYRPKTYGRVKGVEYRTPSNIWLASKAKIIAMATNALSMEAILRNETSKRIVSFLHEYWPVLIAQETLVIENKEQCREFLIATRTAFPEYDWAVGE